MAGFEGRDYQGTPPTPHREICTSSRETIKKCLLLACFPPSWPCCMRLLTLHSTQCLSYPRAGPLYSAASPYSLGGFELWDMREISWRNAEIRQELSSKRALVSFIALVDSVGGFMNLTTWDMIPIRKVCKIGRYPPPLFQLPSYPPPHPSVGNPPTVSRRPRGNQNFEEQRDCSTC